MKFASQKKGYQSCLGYDLNPEEMHFAMKNSKVLFTHSHGANDLIVLEGGRFRSSDIQRTSLTKLDLVYVSSCYSGNSFVPTLYNIGGANAALGFTSTVSASTESNGIHYFNYYVFFYLNQGYDLYDAVEHAQRSLFSCSSKYYGSDSVVIYGNYT